MKIAINCMFCQPRGGGIREYIYNIVNALSRQDADTSEYILYVLRDGVEFAQSLLPHTGRFRIKTLPFGSSYLDVIRRSLLVDRFFRQEEQIEHFDLFHSPFFHAPRLRHARVVITVHDLRFFRYPSTYAFMRYVFLRHAVKHSIRRADHIITISSFTKQEIMSAYHIPSDRITVVLEAINRQDFSTDKLAGFVPDGLASGLVDQPFILSVGHIEPRKNYDRLLTAFTLLKQRPEAKNVKLVIVGKRGTHYKSVLSRIGHMPDVVYLDFVSRQLLLWLYSRAQVFSFPSFYEGFGFPPLEAACMGTISSVARISSMPEVCGDSVDYCDPFDVHSIAESLHRCLFDDEVIAALRSRLEPNLARFSWDDNATQTLAVYRQVLSGTSKS